MKQTAVREREGQSAASYLVMTVVILAALIPLFYYTLTKTSDVGDAQISNALNTLQSEITSLSQLGEKGRTEVLVHLPKNLQASLVKDDTISFFTKDGQTYMIRLPMPVSGTLPTGEGSYNVNLYHNGTHIVLYSCGNDIIEATEQCDVNQVQYCKTPVLGCALPGEIGACNCRCAFDSDCATNRCIIPSGAVTGYCGSCVDNSDCPANFLCSQGVCKPALPSSQPLCKFPVFTLYSQGNPLTWTDGTPMIVADPSVLYDVTENIYKMWFTTGTATVTSTGYATSSDGITWQRYRTTLPGNVLLLPIQSSWQQNGRETVSVLKENSLYKMWYTGYPNCWYLDNQAPQTIPQRNNCGRIISTGYATSSDGITWTDDATSPVLTPDKTIAWEGPFSRVIKNEGNILYWQSGVDEPTVLWDDATQQYKLWYTSAQTVQGVWQSRIGLATSDDGTNWQRYAGNPVFTPAQTTNGYIVGHTNVIEDPQYGYHLFYHGGPTTSAGRIGHAWSSDGINWERNPIDPIVDLGYTTLPNGEKIPILTGGPSALYKDGKISLYFMAAKEPKPGYGTFGSATIHLATADCSSSPGARSPG